MKIHGTGHNDTLIGTSGADIIDGGGGNDTIIGGAGTDTLTGGSGADTFVIEAHSQYDIITDFNPAEGDTILFDYGTSAPTSVYSGTLSDGLSFQTSGGTCYVSCVDYNGDGIMDTQLSVNGDNVFLLGWTPDHLNGSCLLSC